MNETRKQSTEGRFVRRTLAALCAVAAAAAAMPAAAQPRTRVEGPVLTAMSVSAGFQHVCAVAYTNAAYCWGMNGDGRLGIGTTEHRLVPSLVAGGLKFRSIAAGFSFTCALTVAGKAYCWGANDKSQLGHGGTRARLAPTPVEFPSNYSFASITAGHSHACALAVNGEAFCWGNGVEGQIGTGRDAIEPMPVMVAPNLKWRSLSAGNTHTCGVTTDFTAYCWGSGALGDGHARSTQFLPTPVRGDLKFMNIAAGNHHTCAVTTNGRGYCWGYNYDGELGNGSRAPGDVPNLVAAPNELWVAFATGAFASHTCVTTRSALIGSGHWCWGHNPYGEVDEPEVVGVGSRNRLTPRPSNPRASVNEVTVGSGFTCLRLGLYEGGRLYGDDDVWCRGSNGSGQLGDGTYNYSTQPRQIRLR